MHEVVELGGFVEHLHDEGHTEVSFDDFIFMLKTVRGEPVVADEDLEEQAMVDALEGGVDYVLKMGSVPPLPEEIKQMQDRIAELEEQVKSGIGVAKGAASSRANEDGGEGGAEEEHEEELEEEAGEGPESGAAQVWASMAILDFSIKIQINPLQLRKVGAIIKNMQGVGYDNEQINNVCRALFLTQSEEDMATAWKVFDVDESGYLDGEEFKQALPLLGENVSPQAVEKLFAEVDTDGSGMIEFPEFCVMVRAMNPKNPEA